MKTRFQIITQTRLKSLTLVLTLVIALIIPRVQAAPGDLDTSFNAPNGFLVRAGFFFSDVLIQPETGKILALGTSLSPDGSPASLILVRYNTDGTLDSSFGAGGIATGPPMSGATKMAFQSGKIVCAGIMNDGLGQSLIARFNPDGSLDTSFGQNGFAVHSEVPFGSVAIGPDGSIVLVGAAISKGGQAAFGLGKLTSNGALDLTFGSGGVVINESGLAFDVAVLGDGRILAAGSGDGNGFAVWRYNSNGTLDTTFGGGDGVGTASLPAAAVAVAIAVQPDGRIVLAGGAGIHEAPPPSVAVLARFDSSGNLDASFNGGTATTALPGLSATFEAVAIQSDSAIVASGTASSSGMSQTLVSRFTPSGMHDTSFGSGGNVITDFPGANVDAPAVAIQSDGKIVIAGKVFSSFSDTSGLVARYNGDGAAPPPPPSFNYCVEKSLLIFKFNSTTGAYEFRDCSKGFVLMGTGTITVNSCKIDLFDSGPNANHSDRNVHVRVNTCTGVGTVSLTVNSPSKSVGYTDNDITTGICTCP